MKLWLLGLVALCSVIGAFGQIFLKLGMTDFKLEIFQIITNWQLALGMFLYFISFILYAFAIRNGNLSILYPIIALSYIWVMVLALYILKEPVNTYNVIGAFVIVCGVGLIVFKGGN